MLTADWNPLSISRVLTFNLSEVYFQTVEARPNQANSPVNDMYPRFIERRIREALEDTRVVLVCGPRQSGKTTLVRQIAGDDVPYVTLDIQTTLNAAENDPVGFLRGNFRMVIDEIQRAPGLILAIKAAVDQHPHPGRFLLTGSANLMTLPSVTDSLAGRMQIVNLMPLSQAELRGEAVDFLDTAFVGEPPQNGESITGDDLIEVVLSGGYPEALRRSTWKRRQDWHMSYFDAILQRDIPDIAKIEQLDALPKLLRILAEHSGNLVNYSGFGAPLGMNHVTTRKYLAILENLFLVRNLPPWYTNAIKRVTKSHKLHFLDSGLLAAQRGVSPDSLRRERTPFGALLETFVLSELMKIASWSDARYSFSHFRDKDRNEVDIVIEDHAGQILGIEVKASATIASADFSGLRRLALGAGDRFAFGMVLYDHDQTVQFEEKLMAVPISALWW